MAKPGRGLSPARHSDAPVFPFRLDKYKVTPELMGQAAGKR